MNKPALWLLSLVRYHHASTENMQATNIFAESCTVMSLDAGANNKSCGWGIGNNYIISHGLMSVAFQFHKNFIY